MFEAKTNNTLFKSIVDAIKETSTNVTWICSSQGISISSINAAYTSFCIVAMKPDMFDNYECTKPCALGVSLNRY